MDDLPLTYAGEATAVLARVGPASAEAENVVRLTGVVTAAEAVSLVVAMKGHVIQPRTAKTMLGLSRS